MLVGREVERATIGAALDDARAGRGGALVLRGEAGIGKTALLDDAAAHAEGMTVVRTLGVESEAELEFGALHDVCRPLLVHVGNLPDSQAGIVRAALGLGPSGELDRFAIGAATLALLAAAADTLPLLVVVDDAQWIDDGSADALLFAARRLQADAVLVLFAVREGEQRAFAAPGLPSLSVEGLAREAAATLLSRHAQVAPAVAARLFAATGGNPLATIELPALLAPEQLAGAAPLHEPLQVGAGVEDAFARRAAALSEPSRRALLVAAVSGSGEIETIVAAAESLGVSAREFEPAEDAGLVTVRDGQLEFRHPLVRSAVYHAAPPSERRAAHRALADVLVGPARAEARAWHLAGAAVRADEAVAQALEQACDRSCSPSARALALERAARLTPDQENAFRRLAAAAASAWRAGQAEHAARLASEALAGLSDPRLRAETLRLQGAIEFFSGRGEPAAAALLEAVSLLGGDDRVAAVAAAADAVNALVRVRRPQQALETAERARALAPEDGTESDLEASVALAFALCFNGRYGDAEPHLRRADELFRAGGSLPDVLQATRVTAALGWLGRHDDARTYLAEAVERARGAGALSGLPHLLSSAAWQALHSGHWHEVEAGATEAFELAEEIGQPVIAAQALGTTTWLHALRGNEAACRAAGEETRRRARELGFRLYEALVSLCEGLLELGAGRVEEAVAHLELVAGHAEERALYVPGVAPQLELAEAYVRSGRAEDAEALLGSFDRSELSSVPFLRALAARCRGLIADAEFDDPFAEALTLHDETQAPFAKARTQLAYGERLRRARRRAEARSHLRSALHTFDRLGAEPWVRRASAELQASGVKVDPAAPPALGELTPHELRVAGMVATGAKNREVASRLFVTPKTVEYHLRSIYRKLGIHSRNELLRLYLAHERPAGAVARENPDALSPVRP